MFCLQEKKIRVIFKARRAGDMKAIIADNHLMKKIFGTIYKTSLIDIIDNCLSWEKLTLNKINIKFMLRS